MSKQKNLKLTSKNNETIAKKLFKPLTQKEQQTVTGGSQTIWDRIRERGSYTGRSSGSTFW